jgi:predicted DCC family thiol-disulfide oxidoreductase YuxK
VWAMSVGLPVLVYDGDCAFCTSSVRLLERAVSRRPNIVAWQHVDLDELGLTREACEAAVQWIGHDGERCSGERAIAQVFRNAGGLWKIVGVVLSLPGIRWLAGVVYRWTARNRHRLPGGTPACGLNPQQRPGGQEPTAH